MKKGFVVVRWIFAILMALTGTVYLPSIAGILMILFALGIVPIRPLEQFLREKLYFQGGVKAIVLVALFLGAGWFAPSSIDNSSAGIARPPATPAAYSQTATDEETPAVLLTPSTAPTPEPTPTPTPTPVPTPSPTPAPPLQLRPLPQFPSRRWRSLSISLRQARSTTEPGVSTYAKVKFRSVWMMPRPWDIQPVPAAGRRP